MELGGGAGEGEHLDNILQHHHYPVSPQPNCQHFRTEFQLDNNFFLQVIPDTNFVRWRSGSVSTSDYSYVVTPRIISSLRILSRVTSHKPKQHFRKSDPATFSLRLCPPVLSLLAADRVTVVDPEPRLRPHTETALILVETGVEQTIVIQFLLAQIHPL